MVYFSKKDGNLDNYLRLYDDTSNQSRITPSDQVEWARQLIDGMNYFHNVLKIIHRKIRPGYLLVE